MEQALKESELFEGFEEGRVSSLLGVGSKQTLSSGEYLFTIGDEADRLFVVLEGTLETCFPFSFGSEVKDVAVRSVGAGSALGWSALVKPYRFTVSARAAERSTVLAFPRKQLIEVLEADCEVGEAFMSRLAEILGKRLLTYQTMWARELQRAIARGWEESAPDSPTPNPRS